MNADLPPFECYIRKEFLYQLDPEKAGEYVQVLVFGLTSLENKALGFWALDEGGAMLGRVPLHALTKEQHPSHWKHEALELWNAMSYNPVVHTWKRMEDAGVRVLMPNREMVRGTYMTTIDWYGSPLAESAGESGWKCAHLIGLDCGCFALQPNNRILWDDASWVVKPHMTKGRPRPDYKVQHLMWSVEGGGKWHTEDSEAMFYDLVDGEDLNGEQ